MYIEEQDKFVIEHKKNKRHNEIIGENEVSGIGVQMECSLFVVNHQSTTYLDHLNQLFCLVRVDMFCPHPV